MFQGRLPIRCVLLAIGAMCFAMTDAHAEKVTEHLDLGGAVRGRVDYDARRHINEVSLDTLMLSARYDSDSWIGAARYRFYGKTYPYRYTRRFGDISFAEYAWVGYRFDARKQLVLGLNQVPFGLQPYFSSTFYESLGNVVGLEDSEEVGAKYIQDTGDWNWQAGYYLRPAWPGNGTSHGSTYSIVVTPADAGVADGTQREERHLIAVRLVRKLTVGDWQGEIGGSAMRSTLRHQGTGRNGHRHAYALHYDGHKDAWGLKLQFARQQMSDSGQVVTFGGYDGTFNVASRGNLYLADVSYTIPEKHVGGWISGMKVYGSYSLFNKSAPNFQGSQRFILGTSFSLKALWIAVEWLNGRNDPYIGGSSYTQSLAYGGTNAWRGQFYMNVGYYF